MASYNKVILAGNLTADPELRQIPSGSHVGRLRLAVNRRFRTAGGEDRSEVCYVDVEVWDRVAQNCAQFLRKGSGVLVEGRLKMDQWDDRQTGQKRSRLLVSSDNVQFLPGREGQSSGYGGGGQAGGQMREQPAPYGAPAAPVPQQQSYQQTPAQQGNWGPPPPQPPPYQPQPQQPVQAQPQAPPPQAPPPQAQRQQQPAPAAPPAAPPAPPAAPPAPPAMQPPASSYVPQEQPPAFPDESDDDLPF